MQTKKMFYLMLILMPTVINMHPMMQHAFLQGQFAEIQWREMGRRPTSAEINSIQRGVRRGATQAQFNAVRAQLNNLLSKAVLTQNDINQINQKIQVLASYNPARWPRTADYQAVLQAKLGQIPAPAPGVVAPPLPQPQPRPQIISPSEQHGIIQRDFQRLQQQLGIVTPVTKIQAIRKLRPGPQGTQEQLNAVRAALNQLLSKERLTDRDIAEINQKINELDRLNPARWPKPEDYRAILRLRQ